MWRWTVAVWGSLWEELKPEAALSLIPLQPVWGAFWRQSTEPRMVCLQCACVGPLRGCCNASQGVWWSLSRRSLLHGLSKKIISLSWHRPEVTEKWVCLQRPQHCHFTADMALRNDAWLHKRHAQEQSPAVLPSCPAPYHLAQKDGILTKLLRAIISEYVMPLGYLRKSVRARLSNMLCNRFFR